MSDPEALRAQAASLGVPLDPSQAARLIRFEELLADRAIPQGVISASDATKIRERHILDSLRAAPVVPGGSVGACVGTACVGPAMRRYRPGMRSGRLVRGAAVRQAASSRAVWSRRYARGEMP